jgi:autotransporter-associated beta strand protein
MVRRCAGGIALLGGFLGAALGAHAQTTLNATYMSTPWDNTSSLATGSGLTLNLGLGFEYLIVGGGGGGGGNIGGGGGAGGLLTNVGGAASPQASGTYTVTVGAGGAGGNTNNAGANGAASSIFGVSASGGGGGGFYNASGGVGSAGSSGASGGGGSPSNSGGAGGGGVSGSGTGNAGGSGVNTGANGYRAGGGGGAGSAGASTSSTVTGTGGSGTTSSITGVTLTLTAGGGGGANTGANFGIGGSGIGGSGTSGAANGSNGQANTGSGGGGAGYNGGFSTVVGGSGGSGLVIVRYQSDTRLASGGSSSGTTGVWQFERFTSSGSLALSYVAANLLATQSGTITGSGGITYTGAGTLNLTAANTFSGNTRVGSGTLNLANVSALQNSTLDLATADTGAIGLIVAGTNTYTFGGLQGSRNLAFGANSLSIGGNNASTTYSGALSGSGGLTKAGTGSLTLSGSNLHSGGTTLSAGSLLAGNDSALGTGTLTFASGGVTLGTTANRTLATPIALSASGTIAPGIYDLTLSGPITGSGGLSKTGTGTLTISGSNSYSGGTVVAGSPGAGGVLKAGSNQAFGSGTITVNGTSGGAGNTLDVNGATLANVLVIPYVNSGVNDTGALLNTNTSTAAVLNGNVIIGGQNYVGGNGDIVLNGIVSGGTNNVYALYKQGAGMWTFANPANTFDGLYYQIGGVTEVTKLANAGEASSLGQVSSGQNTFVFGFNGSGGGTLRFIGSTASTSDRAFSLRGATAAASNTIEAAGASSSATLTLTGGLTAGAAGSYTARLTGTNAGVNDYAGAIADGSAGGTMGLVKEGSTTWALTGANSYSGATTVTSGTLKVGNGGTSGSLGSGSVTNNARLIFDRTNALTVANTISGTGTLEQAGTGVTLLTGNNSFSGPTLVSSGTLSVGNGGSAGTLGSSTATIAAGATLAVNRSDTFTLANAIGGAGRVLKQGANSLTLSGTNTHTGGVSLAGGTLVVGGDAALGSGTLTIAASGVTVSTTRSLVAPIDVAASGTLAAGGNPITLSGVLSGNGTLSKSGTGTLTLAGANSTFSGNLIIAGGAGGNSIVRAGNVSAFGTGTVTILGGGGNTGSTFDLNGNSLDNSLVIGLGNSGVGDAGALQNSNAATPAVLNGGVSLGGEIYVGGAGDIRFNGLVSGTINPANPYSLYKDGGGTWTFANTANTFAGFYYQVGGATEVTKLANQGQASSLGAPSNATENRVAFGFNGSGGGTLRYIGGAASTSDRVFVLAGGTAASSNVIEASGSAAAATLTLTGSLSASRAGSYAATLGGTNAGVNEYAGLIGNGAGTVSLVKEGSTTWALTGTSTYTGPTTVSAGRLAVNGILGTTPVAVLAAAELGGSGMIGGPVSVAGGGSLAPGNSIASLATGTASFAAGATFAYEVDSTDPLSLGTAADLLVVSGGLNLDAGNGSLLSFTDLNSSPQPFINNTTIFALINYSGSWNGGLFSYGGTPLADGSTFTVGSQQWEIDYNSPTGGSNYTSDYLPSSSFVTVMAVPEPATLALLAIGVGLLSTLARSHRRSQSPPARSS